MRNIIKIGDFVITKNTAKDDDYFCKIKKLVQSFKTTSAFKIMRLFMYNNIIEVIFMTNIDQLDKILQSLNTELQKNKEIEDLKQIDDKFMENVILDLNSELSKM